MKLYTYFRSSAAYRVRIALNVKAVQYESIPKKLIDNEHRSPEYLALNPQGLIPALDVEGVVLSQSLAIIEYLNERYPHPALLPEDPLARAQVRAMALSIACDIHPLNNLRVLIYLRDELEQDQQHVDAWYRHWVTEGFKSLEIFAQRFSTRQRYCFGDGLTLADVLLVPQMFNARRLQTHLTEFPLLVAISRHLESLPEFEAARPDLQPDAI